MIHAVAPAEQSRYWVNRGFFSNPIVLLAGFLALHIPLALVMLRIPEVATVHAILTLGLGVRWTFTGRHPFRVAYIASYVAGAEVLWRKTATGVPWEFAKYAIVGLFILCLMRMEKLRGPLLPALYLIFLLPSAGYTLLAPEGNEARKLLSFNLSGPLLVASAAWFFVNIRLSLVQIRLFFLSYIAPTIGMATIALYTILTTPDIQFNDESNTVTSGGYGPNQVSAVLGLGALFTLFLLLDRLPSLRVRIGLFGLTAWLAAQSAFTFSRGGLYDAGLAAVAGAVFLLRDSRSRVTLLVISALALVLANFVVLPAFDDFSKGQFSARFSDTSLTHRDSIFQEDLDLWAMNPLFGVGPGEGDLLRVGNATVAAHTEYSRMLGEHGLFGLAALVLLLVMCWRNFRRARTPWEQTLTTMVLVWSGLYMAGAAMRLAAPALLLGLSFAICEVESALPAAGEDDLARAPVPQLT